MSETAYRPPYEGNDMLGYLFEQGFKLPSNYGAVKSAVNVRDQAIIVTDYGVWRAKPCHQTGFCIELLSVL